MTKGMRGDEPRIDGEHRIDCLECMGAVATVEEAACLRHSSFHNWYFRVHVRQRCKMSSAAGGWAGWGW